MCSSILIFRIAILQILFMLGVALPVCFGQRAMFPDPIPPKQFLKSSILDRSGTMHQPTVDLSYGFNWDPYFCRKERDMEKQAGFPIRLRLGEWNWVEQYEGKRQKIYAN